ncbi:MAG: MBL fold metallo-hydrolase [Bacteroidota bacterium]
MNASKMTVVSSGDAFGSGGLHATCFYVEVGEVKCLMDIGVGAIAGIKGLDIQPKGIDVIVITHFHGDHFGGLPNFLLDATLIQKRKEKLTIVGPAGLEEKVWQLQEAMYAGTSNMNFGFPIEFKEYASGELLSISDGFSVSAVKVVHSEPSNPHAIRLKIAEKSIVYTGDTEWVDDLVDLTPGSDLLVCECFGWKGPIKNHLSYEEIHSKQKLLDAKKIVLTHLGPEALQRQEEMTMTVLKPSMEIGL